jgi:catalase
LFSYTDTQLSRLGGANFHEIPINRGVCPMHNFQRDGIHRQMISTGRVAYEPNTLGNGTEYRVDGSAQGFQSFAESMESPKIRRRSPSFDDHFSQAALFWNSQSSVEKDHIVAAFRFELSKVEVADIRQRVVDNLAHVDSKLASRVAAPLGIKPPDPKAAAGRLGFRDYRIINKVDEDAALRMVGRPGGTVSTRKIAIMVSDGFDYPAVKRLQQDMVDAGAICKILAPHLGTVNTASGKQISIDHTFTNMPSIMFDAVLVPGGVSSVTALCGMGDAVHFVLEAYKHCKTICVVNEGVQLLSTLGFSNGKNPDATSIPTPGVIIADIRKVLDGQVTLDFTSALSTHRHWDRINVDAIPA